MHPVMQDLSLVKTQQTQNQTREEHDQVIHEHSQALEYVKVLSYDERTEYIERHEMQDLPKNHEHLVNQLQVLTENQFFLKIKLSLNKKWKKVYNIYKATLKEI